MMIIISLILLSVFSYIIIGLYRIYAIKKNILDHPNRRSSHIIPVPRGGGIVFLVLWSIFLMVLCLAGFVKIKYFFMFLPPITLVSLVGFFDDKYQLAARWRFLVQLGAVIYIVIALNGFPSLNVGIKTIHWSWFGYVFMALALLWSINLYNFMDGADGFAAVEALFVFGVGGYFVWRSGGLGLAYASWGIVFVVFGFLMWNKPPAKIFMGDTGSTMLGFLVALFAIIGEKKYNVPVLLWIILYGVFWFDATLTLIRRLINGEKIYQAHQLQAFQRLYLEGWSHSKILIGVIIINVVLTTLAFLAFYFLQYMLVILIVSIVMLTVIYTVIEKIRPMYIKPKISN